MDERDLYRAALRAVAEHAGLEPDTLVSRSKVPRWVSAMRWVLFKLLHEKGVSRSGIARLTNKSWNGVRYVLAHWPYRAADLMPDPEEPYETYAEALTACRRRMDELLNERG